MKTTEKESSAYAGVDIGKDTLDVTVAGQSPSQYANSPTGIAQLIKALPKPVHVICEPSGGYAQALLEALWEAKIEMSLVNAARVRAFARAQRWLAKTDQIDATVLRGFGELHRPETLAAPSPERQRLAALVQRREQLVTILLMEEQRLRESRDQVVTKLAESLLKELKKQVKQIEEMIAQQIDDNDTLKGQSERMQQVKGIGKVTASTLLAEMPELGKETHPQ